ncbi:hypothetical protein CBL_12826 [Carabus blaptoides fortunei]
MLSFSKPGLQRLIDPTTETLGTLGLLVNAAKSHTISWRTIPKERKCVVDEKQTFRCGQHVLPALSREDEWKYLGISFSPEGRRPAHILPRLEGRLRTLTKAPLKPQQTFSTPSLDDTNIRLLQTIDKLVCLTVKGWMALPHDCPSAYVHADYMEGGPNIPAVRWSIPEFRENSKEDSRN